MLSAISSRFPQRPNQADSRLAGLRYCRNRTASIARDSSAPDRRPRSIWTILLQAGQNGEIALIDHRTAVALDVARTGPCSSGVPLRCGCCCWAKARPGTDSDNRVSARKNFRIVFLHSDAQRFQSPNHARHDRTDYSDCNAANRSSERTRSAGKCGQIYGGLDAGCRAPRHFPRQPCNNLISRHLFLDQSFSQMTVAGNARRPYMLATKSGSSEPV